MAELLVRGGVLAGAVHYIGRRCDAEQKAAIYGRFTPELRKGLERLDKNGQYPRSYMIELWQGVASLHDDPVAAHAELIQCGRAHGQEATGSFMRLVVKFLTPKAFARKFPDFWRKDFSFGNVDTDIAKLESDKLVVLNIRDVEGFHHIGPVTCGYLTHGFEAMGMSRVRVEEKKVPIGQHSAPEYQFHINWA